MLQHCTVIPSWWHKHDFYSVYSLACMKFVEAVHAVFIITKLLLSICSIFSVICYVTNTLFLSSCGEIALQQIAEEV